MTYHISSWIINALGKFWQISVENKVYLIFVCTHISKNILCKRKKMTCLYFQKLEKLCTCNCSLLTYNHFCAFFRAHFGKKYKQKLCISAYLGHYLGKIQLVPQEKRKSGWIWYSESTQAVQICSKFILKFFIPQ